MTPRERKHKGRHAASGEGERKGRQDREEGVKEKRPRAQAESAAAPPLPVVPLVGVAGKPADLQRADADRDASAPDGERHVEPPSLVITASTNTAAAQDLPTPPKKREDGMLVLAEEATDQRHGHIPEKRPIAEFLDYGLIPLDKTRGPTSHEVVSWVRKMVGIEKAGHSGTLDPGVSGLLPIGLGSATKALSLLLLFPKEYIAIMRIHSSVPADRVEGVLREFTDEIFQKPPQRSSVKREVRSRRVYEMEILEREGNLFLIRCLCQSGTYIRKLIYDMGEVLGVGATMVELRRTKVGPLAEAMGFVTLHELNDAIHRWKDEGDESRIRRLVRPVERCLEGMKKVVIKDAAVDAVCHGAMLAIPGILAVSPDIQKGETVILLSGKDELVAIGQAAMDTASIIGNKKGIAIPVKRVIMKAGTYPRLWRKGTEGERRAEGDAEIVRLSSAVRGGGGAGAEGPDADDGDVEIDDEDLTQRQRPHQ